MAMTASRSTRESGLSIVGTDASFFEGIPLKPDDTKAELAGVVLFLIQCGEKFVIPDSFKKRRKES